MFGRKKKKRERQIAFDFMDYESKHITPQRFGDTAPQITSLDGRRYQLHRLMHFYKTNALAHRVVSMTAEAATRNHWRIVIPSDENKQMAYQQALNDLQDRGTICKEMILRGIYGDAYMNVNVDEKDKTDLATPLDVHNILKVNSINAFGQVHVRRNEICNDPTNADFGKEQAIFLDGLEEGAETDNDGNIISQKTQTKPIKIDASRFKHIALDKFEDDDSGTSMLLRCYDQLKTLDTAEYSTGKMLYEYNLKVINSDDYFNATDDEQKADNRKLRQGMSTESVVVLGLEDKLQKITTNAGGIDSLFNFAWQQLSAASGIPKSILTGEQSGTLAGASQDAINYYDNIKALQEEVIRPQIEWLVKLLMWSEDCADGSEDPDTLDWHIEFLPLQSQDDKAKTENFVNMANGLKTLTDGMILDTDEAKQMLVSQTTNASVPVELQGDSADDDVSPDEVNEYKKEKEDIKKHLKEGATHDKKT